MNIVGQSRFHTALDNTPHFDLLVGPFWNMIFVAHLSPTYSLVLDLTTQMI